MKISVTRSGGFAGITRRAEVDTDGRPDADDWHRMVARAGLDDPADLTDRGPAGRPDRYVYRIEVDGRTAQVGEADLDEPTRALVDSVLASGG